MKAKINATLLAKITPHDTRFDVFDTEQKGFGLRVFPSGRKSYFYVYHADGRKRRYMIGDADTVKLQQARDIVTIKAGEVAGGVDPGAVRKKKRAEQKAAKTKTVGGFYKHEYVPFLEAERKSGKLIERRIKACFEWLFDKPMSEVTPLLMQSWRKKQLAAGKSAITANRDAADLKAMLSKAVEWGFLDTHPLTKLKPAKTEDNSRVRFLAPDEEARLFAAMDKREVDARSARVRFNEWLTKRHREPLPLIPDGVYVDHLMPMVLLALHTGLRRGEQFSLEWRDIDFLHNLLTVRAAAAKGAKTRHVPLNAAARDVLQRWQKQQKKATGQKELTGFVFPGKAGNRLDNISSSWEKLVTDAKLDDFTFHDLRHTFATRALQKGADIVTLSRLLGHSSLKMTLRYAHTSDAELRAAVDRLNVI